MEPGKTIKYKAYHKKYSGIKGPEISYTCSSANPINVLFHTLTMDFEDQNGDLVNPGPHYEWDGSAFNALLYD